MQNKKIIAILVAIILLVLGIWFFKQKQGGNIETSQEAVQQAAPETPSKTTSLRSLLGAGTTQSCTYSTDNAQGTVYVSGQNVRGDFETKIENTSTKSHMLVKDNTSYIWTDGQTTGFKMAFQPSATSSDTTTTTQGAANFDTSYNYNCKAWSGDSSMFELPAGVTFGTFAMPGGAVSPDSTGSGSAPSQCSYCDALTGQDKTQCLTAFKCN
jgi:hypothetical protein